MNGSSHHRLLQDANLSSEANNHALNVVKTQLHQTEEQLGHEREACIRTKVSGGCHVIVM